MKSIDDNTIVGSGETPGEALEEARTKRRRCNYCRSSSSLKW
ncbi:MAG: hypothetical protein ACE5GV_08830 [Candidatus Scalindua sp.]